MSELLKPLKYVGLVVVLGAGAVACSGSEKQDSSESATVTTLPTGSVSVHAEYFANGTRKLLFSGDGSKYQSPIFEFCDGPDLVEQADVAYTDLTNPTLRSVNHPACDDGQLTPEDFVAPQVAQGPTPR